ncbi:MAG: alpha/beta hydrolase [Gemmatimonadetes bacterium]|nr:alpha/beta hydrolase [Gemmatimonadota bacterium]
MNLAMDCASYASPTRVARIATMSATVLGGAMSFPLPEICGVPGLPRLPEAFRAPVRSDVAALLVAGTFDGRTPPANAREVAEGMPRARVLIIDGASHALMGHPAVTEAMLKFFGGTDTVIGRTATLTHSTQDPECSASTDDFLTGSLLIFLLSSRGEGSDAGGRARSRGRRSCRNTKGNTATAMVAV